MTLGATGEYNERMLRYFPFAFMVVLLIVGTGMALTLHPGWWALALVGGFFTILGLIDLTQSRWNILRNYPVIGHARYLLLYLRPELHQYFVENDTEGRPFNWDHRQLVYDRANGEEGLEAFGTELDVNAPGYLWLEHSIGAKHLETSDFRIKVGGEQCTRPYSASVYNISAMSFGSLSANAVRAMNKGAKLGGFFQCTGEGGLSKYHLEFGGDVCWQIGTGYFGCRASDGTFDAEQFQKRAAHESVKLIEIKISQGAKPGHGGVLPGSKVTPEIADARGVQVGEECLSPPAHSAFSNPLELCKFVARLRELSDGKPVGFKLCVGSRTEFFAICKAIMETEIYPDFITVDGGEGGTGAAPVEFSDAMGMPLSEGLPFVHLALTGTGLRDKIRVAASGKVFSAASMIETLAMGADWCNGARAYMLAIGCIQAQVCHTNRCPVGVATQDPRRQGGVDPADKGQRVANFHAKTMRAVADMTGAMGYDHPDQIPPSKLWRRDRWGEKRRFSEEFPAVAPGCFMRGDVPAGLKAEWESARADAF